MATHTFDSIPPVSALDTRRRREVLIALRDCDGPITERALAARLADRGAGDESPEGFDPDPERVQIDLRHRQLPKLDAAGLVDYDPDAGSVAVTDHRAFDEAWLESLLDGGETPDEESSDGRAAALSDRRNRRILRHLEERDGTVPLGELAEAIAEREPDVDVADTGALDRMAASLHHRHLPALEDCSLIEYDADRGIVVPGDGLDRDDRWVRAALASA